MWGDGRTDGTVFSNEDLKASYEERGEEQVPLGVSGTMVAVDWDSCVADGACIEAVSYTHLTPPTILLV